MENDVIICRCNEVTAGEINEAIADGAHSVTGVKRRTCAGMGLCQGRTCRKMVYQMIHEKTGQDIADIEAGTVRPPVRPVKLGTLLNATDFSQQDRGNGNE